MLVLRLLRRRLPHKRGEQVQLAAAAEAALEEQGYRESGPAVIFTNTNGRESSLPFVLTAVYHIFLCTLFISFLSLLTFYVNVQRAFGKLILCMIPALYHIVCARGECGIDESLLPFACGAV